MTENKRFRAIGSSLYDNKKELCIGNFRFHHECENICNLLNNQEEKIRKQSNEIGKLKLEKMVLSKKIKRD